MTSFRNLFAQKVNLPGSFFWDDSVFFSARRSNAANWFYALFYRTQKVVKNGIRFSQLEYPATILCGKTKDSEAKVAADDN